MALNIRHGRLSAPLVAVTTWPKLSDTGIPPGTVLTAATQYGYGPANDGQTISGKIFDGGVEVSADNLTFRNCRFGGFGSWGILQYVDPPDNSINLKVINCEFDGNGAVGSSALGIGSGPLAALTGCDIQGVTLGIQCFGPISITGNYFHNFWSRSTNPDDLHCDGITVRGGGSVLIENNSIIMPNPDGGTADIYITTENGSTAGVMTRNNLLMGMASYTVFLNRSGSFTITGVTFQDNYIDLGIYGWIGNNTPISEINNVQFNSGPARPPGPWGGATAHFIPAPVQTWLNAT